MYPAAPIRAKVGDLVMFVLVGSKSTPLRRPQVFDVWGADALALANVARVDDQLRVEGVLPDPRARARRPDRSPPGLEPSRLRIGFNQLDCGNGPGGRFEHHELVATSAYRSRACYFCSKTAPVRGIG